MHVAVPGSPNRCEGAGRDVVCVLGGANTTFYTQDMPKLMAEMGSALGSLQVTRASKFPFRPSGGVRPPPWGACGAGGLFGARAPSMCRRDTVTEEQDNAV